MARPKRFATHSPRLVIGILVAFFVVAVWIFRGRSGLVEQDVVGSGAALRQSDAREEIGDENDKIGGMDEKVERKEQENQLAQNDEDENEDGERSSSGVAKEEERSSKESEDNKALDDGKEIDGDSQSLQEEKTSSSPSDSDSVWKLCAGNAAQDYIPCLDNEEAIKMLPSRHHYEHRERHCPVHEDLVSCLVPLPKNYKRPLPWPQSREEIWFDNVPHPGLVTYKKDQSWVKKTGNRLTFPGTGTQFILGADHYIDYIQNTLPDIEWGKHTRVVLDVGCGVASFGGYLFRKDVLTMSFAPKDEHEAQVQLALERGIPAISAVMGTQRLVFPANVFDMVHCARCRVPWHEDGGKLLLEVNRVLRPGGYFVWSAPPVYRTQPDQVQIWKNTSSLAASMCWNNLAKTTDAASAVGVAIFQKPTNNLCYERRRAKLPPLCEEEDKRDAAWYIPMKSCIHKVPVTEEEHGTSWPEDWPQRLLTPPTWLTRVSKGLYGKAGDEEFKSDTQHWKNVMQNSYLKMNFDWKNIRNVLDMKAAYGGFAAALASQPVWVMNVVPIYEPDTLPAIFDRGLFGIYHDWCESFSTYPRTYDLIHADHLLTRLTKRCNTTNTLVEMDRILRPESYVIFRDKVENLGKLKPLMESLHWKVHTTHTKGLEELLVLQKQWWRPQAQA
ncbi:probable methyltransferase PMT27 [Selaginella moellendorffii]|nr:probable methyltransferase PMT27 [Selaginella moellendorffii]|eukprot:XP_002969911.2 probable methyltransferase PMT27 [Selaginella moellendorffii]